MDVPAGACIFVPLAGKSLDMLWLASRGHRVLGVEVSPIAVDQFFSEHHLSPTRRESKYGTHYIAGEIELICGDAFALDADILGTCAGVYDRAALIALPADMRARYADQLYARLPPGCRGLLVTLEYPPAPEGRPALSGGRGRSPAPVRPGLDASRCWSGATSSPRNRVSSPRASLHCTPPPTAFGDDDLRYPRRIAATGDCMAIGLKRIALALLVVPAARLARRLAAAARQHRRRSTARSPSPVCPRPSRSSAITWAW